MFNFDFDKDHDSSASDPKKYTTPCSIDLYRAPRFVADETIYQSMIDFGVTLLSDVSARLDNADKDMHLGDGQAMTIFTMARCTVIETITLN